MKIVIISEDEDEKCEYVKCNEKAIRVVWGAGGAKMYCKKHGDETLQDGSPEFETQCPNCNCEFGSGM